MIRDQVIDFVSYWWWKSVRVGDPERHRKAAELSNAYARGYLTLEEFKGRNAQALEARWDWQLNLTNDLPDCALRELPKPLPATHLDACEGGTIFTDLNFVLLVIGLAIVSFGIALLPSWL